MIPAAPATAATTATSLNVAKLKTRGFTNEMSGARKRLITAKNTSIARKYLLRIEKRNPPRISSHMVSFTVT